jgi:hypothetical protein
VDDVFEATPKLSEVNELSWKKKKSLDSVSWQWSNNAGSEVSTF